MTPKQQKLHAAKMKALAVALQSNTNPNAQSLATSYGLPITEVQHLIGSMKNGK